MSVDGRRIHNKALTHVAATARITPRKDWLIVEPLDWKPSIFIDVIYTGEVLRGRVLAVGPGRYPLLYDGPKGYRTKSWESKAFRSTEVKVGDIVELGGLELRGYLFTSIIWGHREVILCRENDVAIVYD